MTRRYTIGIDEVGRGALMGPVVVAAIAIPKGTRVYCGAPLRDSKKLTPRARLRWLEYLKRRSDILYTTARVSPKIIDRINIAKAANRAATRACARLIRRHRIHALRTVLDGGLYLNARAIAQLARPLLYKTIIAADEKYTAVKLASIVAKVRRDTYMRKVHTHFPSYRIDANKGYGTRAHIAAIKAYGVTPLHRLTFLKKYRRIKAKTPSYKHQIVQS